MSSVTVQSLPESYDLSANIEKKIVHLQNIVKRTILSLQRYKSFDIFGANEFNNCTQNLENIFSMLKTILYPVQKHQNYDQDQYINKLQEITIEENGAIFAVRSECQGTCGKVFQAVGVALPPSIREL